MDAVPSEWPLSGRPLRHLLTVMLIEDGARTVAELVDAVEREGFAMAGRESKTISDALRWEIEHGRVVRLGRATYGPGTIPRQTRRRIMHRVEVLRARGRVGANGSRSTTAFCPPHSDNRATESHCRYEVGRGTTGTVPDAARGRVSCTAPSDAGAAFHPRPGRVDAAHELQSVRASEEQGSQGRSWRRRPRRCGDVRGSRFWSSPLVT